jgi:hypothetical protein
MLLVVLAIAAGLVAGLALGGRLRHLGAVRLRGVGLLLGGSACQLAGSWWGSGWSGWAILVAGYAALIAFALVNVGRVGMVLVAVGLLANLLVIVVDRGMPVRGLSPGVTDGPRHHAARPGDHLTALGDDLHVAALGETISAGDVVLSVGVATTVAGLVVGRRRRARAGSVASPS